MRGAWQLGVLLALLVAPADASAEEHATAALDYEGGATLPPTCPDRDAFASAVFRTSYRMCSSSFTASCPTTIRSARSGRGFSA